MFQEMVIVMTCWTEFLSSVCNILKKLCMFMNQSMFIKLSANRNTEVKSTFHAFFNVAFSLSVLRACLLRM